MLGASGGLLGSLWEVFWIHRKSSEFEPSSAALLRLTSFFFEASWKVDVFILGPLRSVLGVLPVVAVNCYVVVPVAAP